MSTYLKFGIHILHLTPLILAEFPLTRIHCKAEAHFKTLSYTKQKWHFMDWLFAELFSKLSRPKNNLESRPSRSVILQGAKNVLISIVLNDVCFLTLFTQLYRTYPRVGLL